MRRTFDDAVESPRRKQGKRQREDRNEPPPIVANKKGEGGQDRNVHKVETEGDFTEPLYASGFKKGPNWSHRDSGEYKPGGTEH